MHFSVSTFAVVVLSTYQAAALGINCRGSSNCAAGVSAMGDIADAMDQGISDGNGDRFYDNGGKFYYSIPYRRDANECQSKWPALGPSWWAGSALSGNSPTPRGPSRMVETTSSRFKTMTVLTVEVFLSPLETQMSTLVPSRSMLSQTLAATQHQLSSRAIVKGY